MISSSQDLLHPYWMQGCDFCPILVWVLQFYHAVREDMTMKCGGLKIPVEFIE